MGVIRKLFSVTLYVLSSLFFASFASASSVQQEITICYEDQKYLPYVQPVPVEQRGKPPILGRLGVIPDLVITATQTLGLQVNFVNLPWKRCIREIENSAVDAIFAAIWLPERDRWGRFPKVSGELDETLYLLKLKYQVYVNSSSALSWDGQQFSGVKNGVSAPLGYVANKRLEQLGVLPKKSFLPREGLNLVALNRLDGYVVDEAIGNHIIAESKLASNVRALEKSFMKADLYMPVSHRWYEQNPELTKKLWVALKQVREAQIQKILQEYQ